MYECLISAAVSCTIRELTLAEQAGKVNLKLNLSLAGVSGLSRLIQYTLVFS